MLQQKHPCQADAKSLPKGCSSTGMREQSQEDTGRWKVNKAAPFPFIQIKCSPRAKHSFTRHTASVQWGEGSPWPTQGPAGLHLREARASLPPICCGVHRPFQDQKGKQEPSPAPVQHSGDSCCPASRGLHPAAHAKTPCSWFCSQGDLPRERQLAKANKSSSSN